MFDLKK